MIRFSVTARLPNITRLRKAVGDTTPVAREVADTFRKELVRNIILEGIWGKAWPNIAPNTVVKKRFAGKPAGLLRGLIDHVYTSHGAAQATFGFKSPYAKMHHEGRPGPWTITARNKKILFFPVAGQIQRKKIGGTYHRLGGLGGMMVTAKQRRAWPKATGPSKWERYNMIKAKKVIHPGFQERQLLPPQNVIRDKTFEIVRKHMRGGL